MSEEQNNDEIRKKNTKRRLKIPWRIKKQFDEPRRVVITRIVFQQTVILCGSLVAALGFSVFQVPFNLAAGGVSGLSVIINSFTGWPVGMLILALNIPLVVLGYFMLGKWRFVFSTVLAVLGFSFATDFYNICLPGMLSQWPITQDLLLSSIYAGVLFGLGMGMIYRVGGSIGGTSIPARIIYERLGFPMSQSYLFTDGVIVLIAGLVFTWEVALLSILTLVLAGLVTDFTIEGSSQVRTVTIITQKADDVRWAILYQLRRGVSLWPVEGGYSRTSKTLILCTIMRTRVADLNRTVKTVDPDAFIIIGVTQAVWGGYGQRLPKPDVAGKARPDAQASKGA